MDAEKLSPTWNSTVSGFSFLIANSERIDSDTNRAQAENVVYLLKELFEYVIQKAKIKDKWKFGWGCTSHGISLYARSLMQDHDYVFGVYQQEVYLNSTILEAQNIKYMGNEFWEVFSRLSVLKSFGFKEDAGLPDGLSLDTRSGKADTYRLIRNFMVLEEHQPDSTANLGWFEAQWDISEPLGNLLESATEVIKGIHKLNYLLYRREYQKRKASSV